MRARVLIISYIMLVWFVISFVTNLIGPLMPIIIGDFHLSVDKGHADTLVSFCAADVRKTGPTRFESHLTDFRPSQDLHILFLDPAPQQ